MRKLIAGVAFRSIQIVLSPVAVLGYLIFVVRGIMFSRWSGVSATALSPLYSRWMQHQLGVRPDEACVRLMRALPNASDLGLRLLSGPTRLAHRLTGYVPPVFRYPYQGDPPIQHQPPARATFFDAALERHLGAVEQLVILGAGWDTRAYRLPPGSPLRVFEVDTRKTQALKRAALEQAGLDTRRVTFVTCDFLSEDWLERLVQAGFAPDRPAFFLWEGVTMYLDRQAVEQGLRRIAATAPGGVVAFDYFTDAVISARTAYMRYVNAALKATGEPLRFGIDSTPPARDRLAAFLAACGLRLDQQRGLGAETERQRSLGGFATALVEG